MGSVARGGADSDLGRAGPSPRARDRHIYHYGRGEIDHDEAAADRLAASWGGPTRNETWRSFRDKWVRVPVNERDGIPAWGERNVRLSRG